MGMHTTAATCFVQLNDCPCSTIASTPIDLTDILLVIVLLHPNIFTGNLLYML